MVTVKQIETSIGGFFKDLPALPASAKESLVKAWPVIALIFGVLQLLAAWALYDFTRYTENLYDFANSLSVYTTGETLGLSIFDKSLIYLGITVLLVDAVILLMAFGPLQRRARKGWELLFLGSVVNLIYAVLTIFIDGRGIGSFFFSLLGSALGFYLLFQVRDYYKTR